MLAPLPTVRRSCVWNEILSERAAGNKKPGAIQYPRVQLQFSMSLNFAIVGCGGITLQNHLPGLALCPETRVTALCDAVPATLERARQQTGVAVVSTDYLEIVRRDDVDAVIIATPNHTHPAIARAAIAAGKHVLC